MSSDTAPSSKYRSSWSLPGSAERNLQPIADALSPLLSPAATSSSARKPVILEVASGFGHQIHAIASTYPHCRFHPSEADAHLRGEIDTRAAGLPNVAKAESLDLLSQSDWRALVHNVSGEAAPPSSAKDQGLFDRVIACNLVHTAPWSVTESLFSHLDPRVSYVTQQGYRNLLSRRNGWIAIYGAFNENGAFTSEGNAKFDADIRSRNPEFGLRDIQNELVPLAERHGYELTDRIEMPAGNLFLIFRGRKK
ncbi:conserved hypothetical protein [Sporisorium reilianum SRZ2]|uniref:Uncharacterized protein n=1 Tax=Sporisorium reilianum (strain SRZ2) TaxID=999809 RepID=E6ZXU1_SPORE|nr:conserved hypothetical protein [Sporisorium reilianum SRZ2]